MCLYRRAGGQLELRNNSIRAALCPQAALGLEGACRARPSSSLTGGASRRPMDKGTEISADMFSEAALSWPQNCQPRSTLRARAALDPQVL